MEAADTRRAWRGCGRGCERGVVGARRVNVLLCIGVLVVLGLIAPVSASAKTWTVKIANMRFEPASLTVERNDTIVWVNEDVVAHTVTSSSAGGFDSQSIAPGAQWRYQAKAPGRYPYACTFHPTMQATLIVKGKP